MITPNPIIGTGLHAVGGISASTCYIPFNKTKKWSWESYWLVQAAFAWLIMPLLIGFLTVPQLFEVLQNSPTEALVIPFILGALYGFGGGVASPTVFAWTVDLSNQKFRGRGISTLFLSLEIGIGLGALVSGWLFNNETANLPLVFWVCSFLVLMAIVYLEIFWKNKKVEPIVLE